MDRNYLCRKLHYICKYEVHLGRFEQYNSWDVFRMPFEIANKISYWNYTSKRSSIHMGFNNWTQLPNSILYLFTGLILWRKVQINTQKKLLY